MPLLLPAKAKPSIQTKIHKQMAQTKPQFSFKVSCKRSLEDFSLIYISGSELLPWRLDLPGNSSAGKNRNINNNDNLLTLLWATCTTIVFQRVRNEKDMLQTCGAIYGPIVESAEWVDSALDSSFHSRSIIESMQGLQSLITSTSHPSLLNCDQSESVNMWLHCTHLR